MHIGSQTYRDLVTKMYTLLRMYTSQLFFWH